MNSLQHSYMKTNFIKNLHNDYPNLSEENLSALISDNLISPFTIRLPKSVLQQAQNVVSKLFHLRENKDYQEYVFKDQQDPISSDPGNKSICMSYDFHLNSENNLKLIEINTNAAFLLLGYHLYKSKNLTLPITDFTEKEIIANIFEECALAQKTQPKSIAIIDDKPSQQRLYVEFLAFNELFKKMGFDSEIVDINELQLNAKNEIYHKLSNKVYDFIYNRYTDFYFKDAASSVLKQNLINEFNFKLKLNSVSNLKLTESINSNSVNPSQSGTVISPHPHEYALLADKNRLVDWSLHLNNWASFLKDIEINLLKSEPVTAPLSADLWSLRKKLFFKPIQSFGSKMSYRGESISKKLLEQLIQDESILAQEYCPPPELDFTINNEVIKLKYDLRFYAYKDRVQMVIARLYQGQVTNLKAQHGGFACVEFI